MSAIISLTESILIRQVGNEEEKMLPSLGPFELIIILLIIIIIFGVGKLPQIGGALGRGIREFRDATSQEEETEAEKASPPEEPEEEEEV